jgi:hypothetical protein
VHFFTTFPTDSKSALSSAFFDIFENNFWVILALFKKFEAKRAKNGSKNQKKYLVNVNLILILHPPKVCILHFHKKVKCVVSYCTEYSELRMLFSEQERLDIEKKRLKSEEAEKWAGAAVHWAGEAGKGVTMVE